MLTRITLSIAVLFLIAACHTPLAADDHVTIEAYAGEPLGVGRMRVEMSDLRDWAPDMPVLLGDADGRVLYPAFENAGIRVPTGRAAEGPFSVTAYFLFRGDEPLDVQLQASDAHRGEVKPIADRDARRKLLEAWWARYTASARAIASGDSYPPIVENYLLATLARRLDLPPADLPVQFSPWADVNQAFAVMTGAESIRIAAQRDVLLEGTASGAKADLPLPEPPQLPPIRLPEFDNDKVAVEPIARHVPVECLYVRCGSFKNFQWMRTAMDEWGTNLRDLASVRALDYEVNKRIERQLGLRETVLSKMFGDAAISDVAIIGTDTFFRAGPSIGILFEARSSTVLAKQLEDLRKLALAETDGATLRPMTIAGHDVTLLSTPDNRIRSYYAVDGKYHLVTTSEAIARRFFEAGEGKETLADAKEFRWARSKMPLDEDYTVFVYLSDPFFRQITGPKYRIEMTRRMRALSEIDVVRLAQLAAKAESAPASSIDALVAANMLPAEFGYRADGSEAVFEGDEVVDSLRGAYGTFTPVPDVPLAHATRAEIEAYEKFSRLYQQQWQRMDPVVIGIRHRARPGGGERVTFDIHITPYARQHYAMLAMWLPSEDPMQWGHVPGDVASADVNFQGHRYRLGVRDFAPQWAIFEGQVRYSGPRGDDLPMYLAGTQRKEHGGGYLLPILRSDYSNKRGGPHRADSLLGKTWYQAVGDFDLVAFRKPVIDQVEQHLKLEKADRPAKVRLRIVDLADTEIASAINAEGYIRARKVSAGNVHFLHTLINQLHVPKDEALAAASRLLDARPVCPLGGEYSSESVFGEEGGWRSSAWQSDRLSQESAVPKTFRAPLLDWFAGLSLDFNIDATSLWTRIELDVRE